MSNKKLSQSAKQIHACCVLHNFVQMTERESMDAAPVARRSGEPASPAAFDDDEAIPATDNNADQAAAQGGETLAQARTFRDMIMGECVAERRSRLAYAYDERTRRAALIRQTLRHAERADRT